MPNITAKGGFAALAIIGLPLFIAVLLFGPTAFDLAFHRRPPERYLIPAGFTGWTRIEFRKSAAPPLPVEDGHRLLILDAKGALATSSNPQTGHGNDDFYYYSAGDSSKAHRTPISNVGVCKGIGMIWQIETRIDENTGTPVTRFFVGTEDRYRRDADPTGTKLPACE
ncbi:MAG: hypothetical protein WBS24_12040 [Terriglobales bacterium]